MTDLKSEKPMTNSKATADRDTVRAALKANPTDRRFFKELGAVFGKVEFISGKLLMEKTEND